MKIRTGKINFSKEKILITGAGGMVGKALRSLLPTTPNIICVMRKCSKYISCDLREEFKTIELFNSFKPDYVIHLAARVGGIKANSDHLGEFYEDNIRLNSNVLRAAHMCKVKKTLSLLSTCVYPDNATYPLTEDQIHNGPPHSSNYTYAYTKRMLDIQSKAYRDQFGEKFISVIPNNLFGKFDNFNLKSSHVIPSIIHKMYIANLNNKNIVLWGDGRPLREFTYAKDLAEILLFLLEEYDNREPINVGNVGEYSIKYIAETIAKFLNFTGNIIWDVSKPNGQFRKPSCNNNFKKLVSNCGKKLEYMSLENGLKELCEWFINNYPNIRGSIR